MAFLDGARFYDELASTMPAGAGRVIFMTRFSSSDQIGDLMKRTGRPVIHKPINMRQLLSTIQSLTDQHDPPKGGQQMARVLVIDDDASSARSCRASRAWPSGQVVRDRRPDIG